MYFLTYDIINNVETERTLTALIGVDILQFAGIAFIVTGILKKINLKEIHIVGVGLILSVIGSVIACMDTGNRVLDMVLGNC